METEHDSLVSAKSAAAILGLSPRTLDSWRMKGTGPPYISIGVRRFRRRGKMVLSPRCTRYRIRDLQTWIDCHRELA